MIIPIYISTHSERKCPFLCITVWLLRYTVKLNKAKPLSFFLTFAQCLTYITLFWQNVYRIAYLNSTKSTGGYANVQRISNMAWDISDSPLYNQFQNTKWPLLLLASFLKKVYFMYWYIKETPNSIFHMKVHGDIKSCLKLSSFYFWTHKKRKDSTSVISLASLLDIDVFADGAETLCLPIFHCLQKLFWMGATAIMWISHAWSLGILSAPCGTFLPVMKCYCCQCETFSLYQSPSWQPSLFRQTWDNFKVTTFNTRSNGPNFFPIHCSTISFPFHRGSEIKPSFLRTAVAEFNGNLVLLGS